MTDSDVCVYLKRSVYSLGSRQMENHPGARGYEHNCGLGGYEELVSRFGVSGSILVSGVWVDWVVRGLLCSTCTYRNLLT